MCFPEQEHHGSRLSNTTTNAEWYLVVDDCLVIRQLEKVELASDPQLLLQRLSVNADTHGAEFVTTPCHRVPNENIAIQSVKFFAIVVGGLSYPAKVVLDQRARDMPGRRQQKCEKADYSREVFLVEGFALTA